MQTKRCPFSGMGCMEKECQCWDDVPFELIYNSGCGLVDRNYRKKGSVR